MIKHYRKLKIIALVTCVTFVVALITPYTASAHDGGNAWSDNSQTFPTGTEIPAAPKNTEAVNPAQGGCDSGDPVLLHNGEFQYECQDLDIPGREMDVTIRHEYRSSSNFNGMFGFGWTINYYERLRPMTDGSVVLLNDKIRKDKFILNGALYAPPAGRYENNIQNSDGTWTITDARGTVKKYDLNGNLTSITDPNGNQIRLEYDPAGPIPLSGPLLFPNGQTNGIIGMDYRLVRIIDTVGRVINFRYNTGGLLSEIEDFAGRKVKYGYDPATNDLLTITLPATAEFPSGLVKTFTYDTAHNLKTITDPKGQVFVTNHYSADDKVERQDLGEGNLIFTYNGNKTTVTDRKGHVVTYTFNPAGQPEVIEKFTEGVRLDDPPSYMTRSTFNTDGMMTSTIFPAGNGIKWVYDDLNPDFRARGNLLQVRRKADMAANDNDAADLVTRLTYESSFNRVKTVTDPKGNVITYTYDYELPAGDPRHGNAGNLVYIDSPTVDGAAPRVTFSYNAFGQPTEVIDPNGNRTGFDYFPATGYLKEARRDPAGINAVTAYTYDVYGNPDIVTDPENHVTNYDFSEQNWLIRETNPLGFITKIFHDTNGNIEHTERQANPAGTQWQITKFTYTNLNKIKTITDPLNRVTTFDYDLNENLKSVLDAENHSTAYEYDERDLLYRTLDANTPQGVTVFDYDPNGNLDRITDTKNNVTTYEYDAFDRKHIENLPDGTFSQMDYDKNSNLIRDTTPSTAVMEFDYDALNRLSAKRFTNNASLNSTYKYDVGSLLREADTAQVQLRFDYDTLNRKKQTRQIIGARTYTTTFDYYKNDNLFHQTYPSGKVLEYLYDLNDRLTDIKVNTVAKVHYAYDTLDRKDFRDYLTGITQRSDYTFDIADQLQGITNTIGAAGVSQFNYTYDNVGNRKTMTTLAGLHTYNYNAIYELKGVTGAQTHTYNYDNIGNRSTADAVTYVPNNLNQYSKVGPVTFQYDANGNLKSDGTNTYGYDTENRLLTAANVVNSANYIYDALNRRIGKTVNGTTTYFIYSDDDIIEERTSAGTLAADYLYGSEIDEILSMTRGANEYWYFHDGLGSVTDLTRPNGTVAESYTYDPYGTPSLTSAVGNSFMFTGRQWDPETEIYYYRARMYDPAIGRFLQRDPIGYFDSMNLYQYALNSPINFVDPYGEFVGALPWILESLPWLLRTLQTIITVGGGVYLWDLYNKYNPSSPARSHPELTTNSNTCPVQYQSDSKTPEKKDESAWNPEWKTSTEVPWHPPYISPRGSIPPNDPWQKFWWFVWKISEVWRKMHGG